VSVTSRTGSAKSSAFSDSIRDSATSLVKKKQLKKDKKATPTTGKLGVETNQT
jgi:hypothetical protein